MNDLFYVITMISGTNTKLYLASDIGNKCKWIFDREEAIWFETYTEAKDFCNKYFKNFSDYIIEDFVC